MSTALPTDPRLIEDLVDANHILFHQGVVDAFGHVSVRHPDDPNRYLLARNMAPGSVGAGDILQFDLDGNVLGEPGVRVYLERFIHGEIYRLRPDIHAVVHSHSPALVPFSIVPSVPFRPVCHMSGFLGAGAGRFEIRDTAGPKSDLLIRDRSLGAALARSLGSHTVVLMRGHGSTTVAPTLKQVVFRSVYAEVNARLAADALRLGPVEYLTPEEADAASAIEKEVDRPWNFWKEQVRQSRDRRSV